MKHRGGWMPHCRVPDFLKWALWEDAHYEWLPPIYYFSERKEQRLAGQQEIKQLIKTIENAGCKVEKRPSGHYIVWRPDGSLVRRDDGRALIIPATPGDHRAILNTQAELRRVGVLKKKGEKVDVVETAPKKKENKRKPWLDPYRMDEIDNELYWRLATYLKLPQSGGYAIFEGGVAAAERRELATRAALIDAPGAWPRKVLIADDPKSKSERISAAKGSIDSVLRRYSRTMGTAERYAVMTAIDQLEAERIAANDAEAAAEVEAFKQEQTLPADASIGYDPVDTSTVTTKPVADDRLPSEGWDVQVRTVTYVPETAVKIASDKKIDPNDHEAVMSQIETALQVTDIPRWRQYELLAILAKELLP